MRAVGIKPLEARVSEYLRLVKTGESILVTEHETVIAELHPVRHWPVAPAERLADTLAALEESAELSRASADRPGWTWRPRGLGLAPDRVSELLADLHADR